MCTNSRLRSCLSDLSPVGVDASFTLLTSYANVHKLGHEEYELSIHFLFFFFFFSFFWKSRTNLRRGIYRPYFTVSLSSILLIGHSPKLQRACQSVSLRHRARNDSHYYQLYNFDRKKKNLFATRGVITKSRCYFFPTMHILVLFNDILAYFHMHACSRTQRTTNACSLFSSVLFVSLSLSFFFTTSVVQL